MSAPIQTTEDLVRQLAKSPRLQNMSLMNFGRALLMTEDLDPVYCAVVRGMENLLGPVGKERLDRWILAYALFYHVGVASYLSGFKGEKFWEKVGEAAANETSTPLGGRWPRASERRHFRGRFAVATVEKLKLNYKAPEDFVERLRTRGRFMEDVRRIIESHYGFGSWISFKLCDLLDRVCQHSMMVSEQEAMYESPMKGAKDYWDRLGIVPRKSTAVEQALSDMEATLGGFDAPTHKDRKVGLLEFETILCKYHSHLNGKYFIGKDILEGLEASGEWMEKDPLAFCMNHEYQKMVAVLVLFLEQATGFGSKDWRAS